MTVFFLFTFYKTHYWMAFKCIYMLYIYIYQLINNCNSLTVGIEKKKKCNTSSYMGSLTDCAKAYSNITKRCSLCLHEKLAIITYPYRLKSLLKNFNSNN